MTDRDQLKRLAAERAVEFVESGMKLGLGTGSTAQYIVELLGERVRDGRLREVVAVATSRATEEFAAQVGIKLSTLDDVRHLDLALDGADEVDPRLELIKGLGGALLWEKLVAAAAESFVVVVDDSKLVDRLGIRAPLPVEVIPFGWRTLIPFIERLGGIPVLRAKGSEPVATDSGHFILDCKFDDGIPDPPGLDDRLHRRPGVVETGLFLGMADAVVVAGEDGVEVRQRGGARP